MLKLFLSFLSLLLFLQISTGTILSFVQNETSLTDLASLFPNVEVEQLWGNNSESISVFTPTNANFDPQNESPNMLYLTATSNFSFVQLQALGDETLIDSALTLVSLGNTSMKIKIINKGGNTSANGGQLFPPEEVESNGNVFFCDLAYEVPSHIVAVILDDSDLVELATTVVAAGPLFIQKLVAESSQVVFVPTNDAFNEPSIEATIGWLVLPENSDTLTQVLNYHVHIGAQILYFDDLITGNINMENNVSIPIVRSGNVVTVDGSTIIKRDILSNNGVAHAIDRVNFPPGFSLTIQNLADGFVPEFGEEIERAGITSSFFPGEPSTLFVPSLNAVQSLDDLASSELEDILLNHLIRNENITNLVPSSTLITASGLIITVGSSGDTLTLEGSNVVVNILSVAQIGSDGVVYKIDALLDNSEISGESSDTSGSNILKSVLL